MHPRAVSGRVAPPARAWTPPPALEFVYPTLEPPPEGRERVLGPVTDGTGTKPRLVSYLVGSRSDRRYRTPRWLPRLVWSAWGTGRQPAGACVPPARVLYS